MISTYQSTVQLPKLFWQLDEIHVPRRYNHDQTEFDENRQEFLAALDQLQREEILGVVKRKTILTVLVSAWRLKHLSFPGVTSEMPFRRLVDSVRDIAKKYGFVRVWDAAYYDTFLSRLEEKCSDSDSLSRDHRYCGRCGRTIWNDISVKRGVGPVCWHKSGVAS